MAENENGQEKTEEATPRRLEQGREEGQLARSRELPGAAIAVAAALAAWAAGDQAMLSLANWFGHSLAQAGTRHADVLVAGGAVAAHGSVILLPWLLLAMVAGVAASLALSGWNFAPKALALKGERLDPIKGMKRVFGASAWVELSKNLLKFFLVAAVSFAVIWWMREDFARLPRMEAMAGFATAGKLLMAVFAAGALSLVLIAVIDVPWQLFSHAKQMRMTREEVRRESKDTDGKPEVKQRQRQLQAEAARGSMIAQVPKADVIVTNPLHVAVALAYDPTENSAPKVLAKGLGELAAHIREVAAEHRIPMLQAPPLARALYRVAEVDHEIPPGLFTAVAEVLTWVYSLRTARPGAWPRQPSPKVDDELGRPIE